MEKSLYFDYIQKKFPAFITAVVERLNEKNQKSLPYLYKDLLTTDFSADGRWASVLAEYSRVAADVVALDSELPLKSRDTIETASGDIPKIGMKLYLTEKQMKDIDSMLAQRLPINNIVQKIFNDTPRCIEGVWERIEDIFLSELSSGVGLSERNNGTGVRIDMGYYNDHKFGVAALWDSPSAKALDDLQKIFDKALDDNNTITDMWADDYFLKNFYKNEQVRQQFAFNMGFVGNNIPVLSFEQAADAVKRKFGATLHRVARKVKTEINGSKVSHNPWQEGVAAFTCDEKLGKLVWTTTAEETRPVNGVMYQKADEYILMSKYSTNDPLREFTSSQAMAVPVLDNVDRIYTIDTKTVTA